MNTHRLGSSLRRTATAFALVAALLGAATARAASPDFDAVPWTAIGCPAADLTADTSPSAVNFVGDATTYPAAYYTYDATYLYFRFRMDGDPSGPGGFAQYSWTALMQVPFGDPFQYQYQVSLNGDTDTLELWQNTVASNIDFSPLFHDTSEVQLFSQPYALADGSTVNTTPLARSLATGDGSSFGVGSSGDTDYFVDFAIPVATLVANGVITTAADLGGAVFFPATATNPNNYNKGYLNCPFLPITELAITKTVDPSVLLANTTTPLTFSIDVTNTGAVPGRGVKVDDIALPAWMTNVSVNVVPSDSGIMYTVDSTNPLSVRVPVLPVGASVSIQLSADASPTCADAEFLNTATVMATNAMEVSANALVDHQRGSGAELCDGKDNNCDGQIDEGADALCDDGNACNGSETCGGASGCQAGTPPNCDDANACTTDTCNPASGCVNTPIGGCVPCSIDGDCNDGNACTTDTCTAGVCGSSPIPGCVLCSTDTDCLDDGDACTVESCSAGACTTTVLSGCIPCATDGDCNDNNACTTDTCTGGVCVMTPLAGCIPCSTDGDCNDSNACTTDTCNGGVCGSSAIPGCIPCATASDCPSDGNACTTETCTAGVCGSSPVPGCTPCSTDGDCNDGNACTTDTCTAGTCGHTAVPGCVACTTDADCNDHNECTTDVCTAGACVHDQVANCPTPTPENCTDGIDNDGDGLIDCADPDCSNDPACQKEICGDCIDNDGNGLTDFEDPACCPNPMTLTVSSMMLKPAGPKVHGKRLRLKARYADHTPALFDPMSEDTTLQISDASGQLFCQTVGAHSWKHPSARAYRFKDKTGKLAGGLKRGRFKIRRDGSIVFRTAGKNVVLRPADGKDIRVTLRVGNQCAQLMTQVHPKGRALVFP